MRARTLGTVILCGALAAFSAIAQVAPGFHTPHRVGIESEFAAEGPPAYEGAPDLFKNILFKVKAHFGGQGRAVETKPWNKYANAANTIYSTYEDSQGRSWHVEPEQVNSDRFDGYEFVTPPLSSKEDYQTLSQVLDEIDKDGVFHKGTRSAVHFTFDVQHMVKPSGDASELVDTILYIESRWPEIYSAIDPKRYGGITNHFAVPLAANQPNLLKELADMPREQRSYKNVQALFRKYEDAELQLVNGKKVWAWKFRAANYGKLFGLGRFTDPIPVIEIRLPDLNSSKRILHELALLDSVVENGHKFAGPFVNPFAGIPAEKDLTRLLPALDQRIRELSEERYGGFLADHGQKPEGYPKLGIAPAATAARGASCPGVFARLFKHVLGR